MKSPAMTFLSSAMSMAAAAMKNLGRAADVAADEFDGISSVYYGSSSQYNSFYFRHCSQKKNRKLNRRSGVFRKRRIA